MSACTSFSFATCLSIFSPETSMSRCHLRSREGNVASLYAIDYFRTILAPIEYIDKEYTREVASEYVEAPCRKRNWRGIRSLSDVISSRKRKFVIQRIFCPSFPLALPLW